MLGKTFYNQSIRKILVAFGTIFNNINIEREKADGTIETIKIPLAYAPRARFVQRLNQTFDPTETEVQQTWPRMSYEWTDISYDSTRKLNTMQRMSNVYITLNLAGIPTGSFITGEKVTGATSSALGFVVDQPTNTTIALMDTTGTFTDGETITGEYSGETAVLDASTSTTTNANRISYRYERVPYNLSLQLAVAAKTTEDGLKVIEQILPFFTPEFTVTIRDVVKHDMPVLLSSITQDDTWEGDFTERRFIIWSLDFEVKSYLYGPSKNSNIITKTITQIYANNDLNVTDFTMDTGGSGTFRVGEIVYQGTEHLLASSTATVTSWNSSSRVLQVTGIKNTFDLTEKVKGSESGAEWILGSTSTLFESPTSTALGTAAARIVQEPDPTTADADDKWNVTTTITENP
tara:strand:- start:1896 stop:3113 length:1218 start_codon:yes stop_codon:yes gene_type:complete